MKCEEMTDRITDRLNGTLGDAEARELEQHLERCGDCRDEAAALTGLWERMGDLDERVPSDRMRARFYSALNAYGARDATLLGRMQRAFERLWPQQPALQLGLALGALIVGLLLGGRFGAVDSGAEIRALRQEMQSEMQAMHRSVSLSLLDHQSASERLRGVEWSRQAGADRRVVDALLETVHHDPSANVRLAAIEALSPLVGLPRIGSELVDTLQTMNEQDPPMVRVSLAELLLEAGVEGSDGAVRRLLEADDLDDGVKSHLQTVMRTSG